MVNIFLHNVTIRREKLLKMKMTLSDRLAKEISDTMNSPEKSKNDMSKLTTAKIPIDNIIEIAN